MVIEVMFCCCAPGHAELSPSGDPCLTRVAKLGTPAGPAVGDDTKYSWSTVTVPDKCTMITFLLFKVLMHTGDAHILFDSAFHKIWK